MIKKSSVGENVKFFERKSRDSGLSEIIRKFDNHRINGRNQPKKSFKITKGSLPTPIPALHSPKPKPKVNFSSWVISIESLNAQSVALDLAVASTVCTKLLQLCQEHDAFIKSGDMFKSENMASQVALIEEIRALVVKSTDVDRVSLISMKN